MKKCLTCNKNEAQIHTTYGVLPCKECQERQNEYRAPDTIELATEGMREERKKYHDDILQKYRGDTPSREYANKYGKDKFTKEEQKRLVYVNNDINYYKSEG